MSDGDPEVLSQSIETFGDLLARHRRSSGLTQEMLASASGISARSISDMERGRVRAPQQRTLQALSRALTLDERAHWEFLRVAKAGRTTRAGTATPEGEIPRRPAPPHCQLPPDVADFAGREQETRQLLERLDGHRRADIKASPIVVVFGSPGVGKTAFAVHIGHRLRDRYPDGRLFIDLRGMDANRLSAHEALGLLLTALGVVASRLPDSVNERSNLYRSLLFDRRMIVVLDNVANEAQVRPLIPSSANNLLLLTSRRVLSGLEAVGWLQLDVLDTADATRLLESIVGTERTGREPDSVRRVVRLCGNLPLALRIAGNRLASRPRWRINNLVRQLDDEQHRLSALVAGDLQVRSAFEVSYRQCDPISALVFRRLALAPGPDITVPQAAIVAGLDQDTIEHHLEELVDASLLDTAAVEGRYVPHDLLRLFARERLATEENPDDMHDAQRRLTEWLLRKGIHAGQLLAPATYTNPPEPEPDDAVVTAADAVHWLDAERSHWQAALRIAVEAGRHAEVLAFAKAMHWYSDLRPTGDLWREVFTYGVRAAQALGRRRDEATQLNFLGWALSRLHGLHQEAARTHRRALAVAREVGDRTEEAWALLYCGRTEQAESRPENAVTLLRSAITGFRAIGKSLEEHIALSFLGLALHELGRYPEAIAAHRTAVAEFGRADSVSHRNMAALGLLRLADTIEATGDWAAANTTYREAGAIAIGVESHRAEATAWFGCGRCRHELGDLHAAAQHLEIALTIFTDIGERWMQARVLHRIASVLDHTDPTLARAHRERALEICRQLDTTHSRGLAASLATALAHPDNPAGTPPT